jgi:hypothetical protein
LDASRRVPDDGTIPDETRLYRRLHPTQVVWDDNQGCIRVSSGAFTDEFMSVNLGNELERINEPPTFALRHYPIHSLAWLSKGFVQSHEQEVRSTPTPDDSTHGEVVGRKKGSRSRQFAKEAKIEILRRDDLQPDLLEHLKDDEATP